MNTRYCWNCGWGHEIRISAKERDELLKMWDKQGYLDGYRIRQAEKRKTKIRGGR